MSIVAGREGLRKVGACFNFDYMGRIADASFLAPTDYARIEKALGSVPDTITVEQLRALSLRRST